LEDRASLTKISKYANIYIHMNNNIFPIIKYSSLIIIGLFSYTFTAFASGLVLTPATVTSVSETSADFVARVTSDGWAYPSVWFEWGETQSFEKPVVGMTTIATAGTFYARLSDLRPQTTYYFRAVAMDRDGYKIASPTVSFTTKSTEVPVVIAPVVVTPTVSPTTYKDTTQMTKTVSQTKKTVVASSKSTEKNTTYAQKSDTGTTVTNANMASVIGAGGPLPSTLIGWILIFISVFVVVLLAHMIYKSNEERKLLEEAKMKALSAGV